MAIFNRHAQRIPETGDTAFPLHITIMGIAQAAVI
jgi:hypothetical protein